MRALSAAQRVYWSARGLEDFIHLRNCPRMRRRMDAVAGHDSGGTDDDGICGRGATSVSKTSGRRANEYILCGGDGGPPASNIRTAPEKRNFNDHKKLLEEENASRRKSWKEQPLREQDQRIEAGESSQRKGGQRGDESPCNRVPFINNIFFLLLFPISLAFINHPSDRAARRERGLANARALPTSSEPFLHSCS